MTRNRNLALLLLLLGLVPYAFDQGARQRHDPLKAFKDALIVDGFYVTPGTVVSVNMVAAWCTDVSSEAGQQLMDRNGRQDGTRQMIELLRLGKVHGYETLRQAVESALEMGKGVRVTSNLPNIPNIKNLSSQERMA